MIFNPPKVKINMKRLHKIIWGSIIMVLAVIALYLDFSNKSDYAKKVISFIFFFSLTIFLLVSATNDYKKKYNKVSKEK